MFITANPKYSLKYIFAKNTDSLRPENPIGIPFYELSEVDSTNNYAMRQVQAQMAGHGATWFAWYQNAGKGQRGKLWKAARGENITMSSVVEPAVLNIENQFLLSITVALACFDFFNSFANGETYIKWPNDIYWRDRKAGGILIENILKGKDWRFSIVGVGININQILFSDNVPNPVSLKQITGKTFNIIDMAKQLCKCIDYRWNQLRVKKYQELLEQYNANLYKLGEAVTFKKNTTVIQGKVLGVNSKGELLLDSIDQLFLASGSVEWIIN